MTYEQMVALQLKLDEEEDRRLAQHLMQDNRKGSAPF